MLKFLQKKIFTVLLGTLFLFNYCFAIGADNSVFDYPLTSNNQSAFIKVQVAQAKVNHVYGAFTQTRYMKLLSKPLVSSGLFELSKKEGLKWLQQKPFQSTLIVTEDKIEQSIEGKPAIIITKKEQPIVFSFTQVFLSIFNGNTAALKQYFKIYFVQNNNTWHIGLKPLGSPLNKAIESVEITGSEYASRILVVEKQSNQMMIQFHHVKSNLSSK